MAARVRHLGPDGLALGALALVAIAIFTIRLTGLPNLVDNEGRLGASVLNVVQGGNWLIPHDGLGNTDKPPMLAWLAALASLAAGRVSPFTLYLPTALATFALAALVFATGRRYFDRRAGLLGGLAYLLSNVGAQQMATARWDGLFALTVTLVALAAFHAWTAGRGWTVFWLAAAAATLTKGPLGLVLGALGLLAVPWERRSGRPLPLRGSHALGLALFVLIAGGWFLAAYLRVGRHLIDDMIRSELIRHAVMGVPGHRLGKAPSDFLGNFAPWSVLTFVGLWRVWTSPAADDGTRRFERFCFCWFLGGLLLFALSPHSAARLLYPVVPPAAILAGRELDRLARALDRRTLATVCAALVVLALAGLIAKYHHLDRRRDHVRRTLALLELENAIRSKVGTRFPLTYARDVPFALQLAFDTMRPTVTYAAAAALLRDPAPAYVVVHDLARLRHVLAPGAPPLYQVAACTAGGRPYLRVVSNRPRLEWNDPMAVGLGPLRLRLSGVHVGPTQDGEIVLERRNAAARLTVVNAAAGEPATVSLRVAGGGERSWHAIRTLAAGEPWSVRVPR
jgi:4-amino-4-deoxy-L-arabinose transferase-like glycosyltransferase